MSQTISRLWGKINWWLYDYGPIIVLVAIIIAVLIVLW